MLFERPNDDELYAALIARDDRFAGQAWVGVTSTGVFCRLTCPARKPKRENTVFFDSPAACIEAGFRPCKRCQPLSAAGAIEPAVSDLVESVLADPNRRWRERDLVDRGLDPSTVRRAFQRQFGATFLSFARSLRLAKAGSALAKHSRVIDAQVNAGFDSASGFRSAFAQKLGRAPGQLDAAAHLRGDFIETPLGPMLAVANPQGLVLLEFFDRPALPGELKRLTSKASITIGIGHYPAISSIRSELGAYFAGQQQRFETPLCMGGTQFSRTVWRSLRQIPAATTTSYSQLAAAIGQPSAARAVARANGANTLAIVIPCHRVIGADGSLTGYGGGTWRKQWLIDHEQQSFGGVSANDQ
ncbi:MAG: trifunctional transcriptional activator/DNA repair protein Ada/methylated-DNA--[protein]-cysteine S-methyltransferase [Pseudomonadota bacterium]